MVYSGYCSEINKQRHRYHFPRNHALSIGHNLKNHKWKEEITQNKGRREVASWSSQGFSISELKFCLSCTLIHRFIHNNQHSKQCWNLFNQILEQWYQSKTSSPHNFNCVKTGCICFSITVCQIPYTHTVHFHLELWNYTNWIVSLVTGVFSLEGCGIHAHCQKKNAVELSEQRALWGRHCKPS